MMVKKASPCSLLGIQGVQEWLDETALQGLCLVESFGFARPEDCPCFWRHLTRR